MGFGGFWEVFWGGADNVLGCPPYKRFSWTCCYAIHSSLAPYPGTRYQLLLVTCKTLLIFALLFLGRGWGGLGGGADNVLGCPPYKIFSWTCCYAIHSSLALYPGTRYQLLLVTCKTLLIFALLFLGAVLGEADNVLGCPPYKIFSWTCCYAIHSSLAPYPGTRYQLLLVTCKTHLIFALLFLGGVLGEADNVLGCPPYKIFSWTCCYAIHSSLAPYPGTRYQLLLVTCKTLLIFALLFLGGVLGGGGADSVLGCPPYKIFSWTCCYAIHSSLAPYPGTRYQLLLVTCKTLLIFALLFLGGVLGEADNVLGCPPYKIFSWTCCYAIHSSLAPYPGTRYQLLLVTCKTLLIFALLFLGGVLGGADNVLGCPPYKIFSWTCCCAIHSSLAPYPGTRYQLLLVTCKTLLIFALLFLGGVGGGFGGGW